jgi:tripartite-type tricarboxylate transporter receptor subunit TctC
MKLPRRQFLGLAASAAVLPTVLRVARADSYPTRPVRLLVGFPPGGVGDILARLIGQWLSERLGQPFVIENRPGAAGNIGTEAVARAPADGYTLIHAGTNNATSAALYEKLNFNFIRDIAPVASTVRAPNVMVVHPSFSANTVPEFIAYAKANPGTIDYASSGNGGLPHLASELFKMMTGIEMRHVPYRGSAPALTDLLGGRVKVMFDNLPSSIEHIRSGKLRALAVTTEKRAEALPDTPALDELVPGYDATGWYGIGAPKNTPTEIIDKLNREINAGLADTKMKARIAELGGIAFSGSPGDFGRLIAVDTAKWAKVVKFAGIKLD